VQSEAQDEHLAGLRDQLPLERMAGVRVRLPEALQLGAFQEVQRRGREGGHVADDGEDHGAQILEQVHVPQHPAMSLAGAEVHQVAVQLQDDGAVAGDEAQFPEPRLQKAALGGGGKEMDGNLKRNMLVQKRGYTF